MNAWVKYKLAEIMLFILIGKELKNNNKLNKEDTINKNIAVNIIREYKYE